MPSVLFTLVFETHTHSQNTHACSLFIIPWWFCGGIDGVGEAASEEQPHSPGSGGAGGAAGGSSPMLVGSGDQAPRPSRLVGLPIKWRPLFPTTAYTYTITNQDVLTAVAKSSRVSNV